MRLHTFSPGGAASSRFARAWLLVLALAASAPAGSHALDLPVVRPELEAVTGPAYLGDRLELRLRPGAAPSGAAMLAAPPPAPAPVRLERLGVPAVDRLAQALGGAWFEPEFRGETAPPAGSGETDFTAFYLVHLPPEAGLEAALERFRALPEVASADPIAVLPVAAVPNDSLWSLSSWYYQPSRRDIHVTEAWDLSTGDPSIVIAILDTGVLTYHPDLGGTTPGGTGQIWTNAAEAQGVVGVDDDGNGYVDDVRGWDFVHLTSGSGIPACEDWQTPDNDPRDYAGHGTLVAGIAGALSDNGIGVTGTAWNVRLMPLRIGWSASGASLGLVDMAFVAQAIRYATRNGAAIINCSFSTENTSGLFAAAEAAVRAGVTVVVASGNAGQLHDLAERPDVIAVGASDASDQVWFSSNTGDYVDLSAPGHEIISTFVATPGGDCIVPPAYSFRISGTSFAAPMVSGAVALMQSRRRALGLPLLAPHEVLLRIADSADDIAALNPARTGYGTGRLNVHRALADPPGSSADRIGGLTVDPAVVFPSGLGPHWAAHVTTNGRLLIVEGRDDTVHVVALPAAPVSGLAAADRSTGGIGLHASLDGGRVAGFDANGMALAGWPVDVGDPGITLSLPALGDLDGDGSIEVVCAGSDASVWAWHEDGSLVAGFPASVGLIRGGPALSDLDGVAGVEIAVTTQSGDVFVLQGSGAIASGWPVRLPTPILAPAIGRLGTRPGPVVMVAAGTTLKALSPAGAVVLDVPLTSPAGGTPVQDLALGDLDGDGSDEIVVVTRGPATVSVYDSAGTRLTSRGWPKPPAPGPAPADTFAAAGPPLVGPLSAGADGRGIVVFARGALRAFTGRAARIPALTRAGGAGRLATLFDLDRTTSTQVLAGAGDDSLLYVFDAGAGSGGSGAGPWFTPRGNFARTGSRLYAPALSAPDLVPPEAVADLAADSIGLTSVRLRWSAPGDDGRVGRAAAYEVRGARRRLDAASFASGDSLPGAPLPGPASQIERMTAGGLEQGVTHFFALRTRDEAGNASAISNLLVAVPGTGEPGQVTDLAAAEASDTSVTLTWSATGDDGAAGRPVEYLVYASAEPTGYAVAGGLIPRAVPATQAPGLPETFVYGGLDPARRYAFGVIARDDESRLSPISNFVVVTTEVGGPLTGRSGIAIAGRAQPSGLPVELYWQGPGAAQAGQSIRIFDVAGRRLRTLGLADDPAGIAKWDGRDDGGDLVPAGLYYARLISGSFHAQTRVVLLP